MKCTSVQCVSDAESDQEADEDVEEEVGLESLVAKQEGKSGEPLTSKEDLTDIAATAQSLQPTGFTLETTQVSSRSEIK